MTYIVDYVYWTGEATTEGFDTYDEALSFAKKYDGTIYTDDDDTTPIYPR